MLSSAFGFGSVADQMENRKPTTARVLRWLLALTLLAAAIAKALSNPEEQQNTLYGKYIGWSGLLSMAFLAVELGLSVGLLIERRRFFLGATAVFFSTAVGLLSVTAVSGEAVNCGCFGSVSENISVRWILLMDCLLAIAAALAFHLESPNGDQKGALPVDSVKAMAATPIPRATQPRAGFSLVELLVVIGIVAVLIGLLLPALRLAKDQAVATTCRSRLQQVGHALSVYASENKGYIPRFSFHWSDDYPSWVVEVARKMHTGSQLRWEDIPRVKALQCQAHPKDDIPTSYVMNTFAFASQPDWRPAIPTALSRIKSSATVPLVLEASNEFGASTLGFDDIYFESRHVAWKPEHVRLSNDAKPRVEPARHRKSSNCLMADMHVESRPASAFNYQQLDDGVPWKLDDLPPQ